MSFWRVASLAFVVPAALTCATFGPDRSVYRGETRRDASVKDVPVRGAHVIVQRKAAPPVEGELLAVNGTMLWLSEGDAVVSLLVRDIAIVQVRRNEEAAYLFGAWTGAGALSTLSHGFFLVATLPTWLCVGGSTTAIAMTESTLELEPFNTDLVRQYARFPQGMPQNDADADAAAAAARADAGVDATTLGGDADAGIDDARTLDGGVDAAAPEVEVEVEVEVEAVRDVDDIDPVFIHLHPDAGAPR